MPPAIRNLFPYLTLALLALAVAWAVSFSQLPPADFTFNNGDQIKTVDPSQATGAPENRIINGLFEGLLRNITDPSAGTPEGENVPLKLVPGVAESLPTISEDGKTYVFRIRESARWSNDRPVDAHDFVFSWQRLLHPETASEYAYQLHYVEGGEAYNLEQLQEGEAVEVELYDRPNPAQQYPRGTIVRGTLTRIHAPPPPTFTADTTPVERDRAEAAWKRAHVYTIEAEMREAYGQTPEPLTGTFHYSKDPDRADYFRGGEVERCHHVLVDFNKVVGVRALDKQTLEVRLASPTAYFPELVAFYPLYPVCREAIEKHGSPEWTRPENIVGNGPFRLQLHRMRDRIRMVKSDTYWNRDNIKLNIVDALAVKSESTALNMYLTGQVDWINTVPNAIIPDLRERDDFLSTPMLTTYYYRLNTARPPLDNVLVRRALNAAIDKRQICEHVMKAGQVPARSYVPPGMAGYESPLTGDYDVEEAKRLLAEAGYPDGKGLPTIQILYNTNEDHATIAQVIQQQWARIGVRCELRNLEWGGYLAALTNTDYMAARSAWIGDYPDPNTFLDMFVTDGPNNQTNWSNAEYDRLIAQSKKTLGNERVEVMQQAERILMDELPIIPIYYYVSKNMVNPRVKGFHSNVQDIHPLELLSIEAPSASDER